MVDSHAGKVRHNRINKSSGSATCLCLKHRSSSKFDFHQPFAHSTFLHLKDPDGHDARSRCTGCASKSVVWLVSPSIHRLVHLILCTNIKELFSKLHQGLRSLPLQSATILRQMQENPPSSHPQMRTKASTAIPIHCLLSLCSPSCISSCRNVHHALSPIM